MKTALVGIVRDEAADLLPWLGWHAKLGVDTFVIFDDGSVDGTDVLLRAAAALYDVRVFRLPPSAGPVDDRQRLAYHDALKALRGQVDWVGLLDSDEYLDLHRHETVQEFLSAYGPDVGAVGINWCLHGSNGHVTRPAPPPFHAFTRHSRPEEAINRHVKSFLRPEYWQEMWANPHFFSLEKGRYVDPAGIDIVWERLGITAKTPDWATARIRHYQVRSMEQFTERARRRADLGLQTHQFLAGDINTLEDLHPQTRTNRVLEWMRDVVLQGAAEALAPLERESEDENGSDRSSGAPLPVPSYAAMDAEPAFALFPLIAWDGRQLGIGKNGFAGTLEEGQPVLHLLQLASCPERGFLIALRGAPPTDQQVNHHVGHHVNDALSTFTLLSDRRLGPILSFALLPGSENNRFVLRNEGFLSAPPQEPLIANRYHAQLWENFGVGEQMTPAVWQTHPPLVFLQEALSLPPTLESIGRLLRKNRRLTLQLLPLFHARLSKTDRERLEEKLGPFLSYLL